MASDQREYKQTFTGESDGKVLISFVSLDSVDKESMKIITQTLLRKIGVQIIYSDI